MNYDITDINLAREGALKSEWADQQMPVLQGIRQRFAETRPWKAFESPLVCM